MTVVRIKQSPESQQWMLVDEQDIPLLARVLGTPAHTDGDTAWFPFRQAAVDTATQLGYDIDFAGSDPAVAMEDPIEVAAQDPFATGGGEPPALKAWKPDDMGSFDEPAFPESDGALLARLGVDGLEWAREFCQRFSNAAVVFDEQLMLGWFANAIEAGRSVRHGYANTEGQKPMRPYDATIDEPTPPYAGLCPEHVHDFYMPLREDEVVGRVPKCPMDCERDLVIYKRVGS